MRRLILVGLVALVTVAVSMLAQADRIEEQRGTITVTLDGADSIGWRALPKVRMCDLARSTRYDAFEFCAFISNFAQTDSAVAGEGVVDTGVFVTYAGTGAHRIAISYDTVALPCSLSVHWPSPDDTSGSGVVLPNDSSWQVSLQDWVWVEYRLADTAGTSGSIAATGQWWLRLLDKECE